MSIREADIERLWIQFHHFWVAASEQLRVTEEHVFSMRQRHRCGLGPGPTAADLLALEQLRQRERHYRSLLDQFERRQRHWRATLHDLAMRYS